MKASFRKYITKEISSHRPVWSEMARATSVINLGLPTHQGLTNVVMMAGYNTEDRARVMKWLLNKGLFMATQFRNELCDWALDLAEEVPLKNKPRLNFGDIAAKRLGTGTSGMAHFMAKESFLSKDVPEPLNLYGGSKDLFTPLDLFNPTMRKKIPELGAIAPKIDARWEKEFYNNFKVPIVDRGRVKAWYLLKELNELLESKGYEGFRYGGPNGYLNYVEKGDWMPESEKAHWQSDPAQRHGPDLSYAKIDDDDPTGTFYKFSNIGSPRSQARLADTVTRMERDFIDLAGSVESGNEIVNDMHKSMAQRIKAGDFDKQQIAAGNSDKDAASYAKNQWGVVAGMGTSEFSASVIPELYEFAKDGLAHGKFPILRSENIPSDVQKQIFTSNEGGVVTLTPAVQEAILAKMFRDVDFNNLESQDKWTVYTRDNWYPIFSKITGHPSKEYNAWGIKKGGRYELSTMVSQAAKTVKRGEMSDTLRYELKQSIFDTKQAAREVTQEARPLTQNAVNKLLNYKFLINGDSPIPSDVEEVKQMVDDHSRNQIVVKNAEDEITITKQGDKYFLVFNVPGDSPYKPRFGTGLAAGTNLPADQDPRTKGTPMSTPEDQEELERNLLSGLLGGEDNYEDAYSMSSDQVRDALMDSHTVSAAVSSAKANWLRGNHVGSIQTKDGVKKSPASKEDFEQYFGGDNGLAALAIEGLKAMGGHWAMKYGFITDDQYKHYTEFDTEKEMKDFEGGRTLESQLKYLMDVYPTDTHGMDKKQYVREVINKFWNIVKSGDEPTEEDFPEDVWDLLIMAMYGGVKKKDSERGKGTAFYGRMVMLRNWMLARMRKTKNAGVNTGGGAININTDSDGEGRGHNPLEAGRQAIDLVGQDKQIPLDDNIFHAIKGGSPVLQGKSMKAYGRDELPDSLEELQSLIDQKKAIPISVEVEMPKEQVAALMSTASGMKEKLSQADQEFLNNYKGSIKVKTYLYQASVRDTEAEEAERRGARGVEVAPKWKSEYVVGGNPPALGDEAHSDDEQSASAAGSEDEKPQRKVSMTGFVNPDEFGAVDQDYKTRMSQRTDAERPKGAVPAAPPTQQAQPATTPPPLGKLKRPSMSQPQTQQPAATPPLGKLRRPNVQESLLPSYKSWKETYAVYDPKKKNPPKGSGFNWWGTPGNAHGTEIGGEVETANSDPDGTKGTKDGKRRKKRAG